MFRTLSLLFLLACIPSALVAQGSIRGAVADSTSGERLVGVNVFLVGTALGNASDIEGSYRLTDIPSGTYTLRASYLGYVTKDMSVDVEGESDLVINFQLSPTALEGEEVIITGQARGQVAAINQQINASTILNVVSEERIQELPDVNAAEVIGRLPGVSLLRSGGEANKVILRGLSDKFTTVTVDGVKIPPTDADARGVDLSTVSQGSLAGIELYKALTPDKDADAIAGTVNLVTKKAPEERLVRLDVKGGYNDLAPAYDQYDIGLRYGERFFDNALGVQLGGNLERRNRSNESFDINYTQTTIYQISNFLLQHTNEIRSRQGANLLLDFAIPDGGSLKANAIYNETKRDYLFSTRNYPVGTGVLLTYTARDREQKIRTFNGSLQGEQPVLGFDLTWGVSLAQSLADFPYDYAIDFLEPSFIVNNEIISGMRNPPSDLQDHPERLIPYAVNNFQVAYLNNAYYRNERNLDLERSVFANISRRISLMPELSAEIKAGGRIKTKDRSKSSKEFYSPYYLGYWRDYERLPDGTLRKKDFTGTRFQTFYDRFLSSGETARTPFASDFLDDPAEDRDIYGRYNLAPIVNRDALRLWYALNKDGVDNLGRSPEYYNNPEVATDYYDITERVRATYLMGTFDFGDVATVITGFRTETEDNDYRSRYSPTSLGGFPIPSGLTRDTLATHGESVFLPHAHLTFRPTEWMNIRLAAYRALSRPDFNLRLEKFVARGGGGNVTLVLGNSQLRTAKAWNYEVNTSFFGDEIGLISVSAFFKEITDMHHLLSGASTQGNALIDSFGLAWRTPHSGSYALTVPYNSPYPTKVWGFEFEHQINFRFLPSPFQNIVLSYNVSAVRSQTHLYSTTIETTLVTIPGFPFPIQNFQSVIVDRTQKLEGQPEFYGNVSLGYDIGGTSIRLSVFHQGEFNQSFTASGTGDVVTNAFTRWDMTLKQEVTDNLSLIANLSNISSVEENTTVVNRVRNWYLLNTSERYGFTADLGFRFTL